METMINNRHFIHTLCAAALSMTVHSMAAQAPMPMTSEEELPCMEDTMHLNEFQIKVDDISRKRWFQATYAGVPLIIGGLIEKHYDSRFRCLRNDFMPQFHRSLDNYTQFAPAALMLGMKVAGVPSRSSWGRMILSDAISAALMTGVVQCLKSTTNITRPDGSNNHSFPSGHTATAFMTATMLSKEYGYLSPWVSVGTYSVATATGLMRMANNKHWLSDVMVGAGIGIMATEFGYWITDAIRKDKGLNIKELNEERITGYSNPSFFGLYLGFNIPISNFDVSEKVSYKTSMGTTLGAEGAYFFNRYIGIGGRVSISNIHFIVNDMVASENTIKHYDAYAGPYFSLPLTARWTVGTKLLAGYTRYGSTNIGGVDVPSNCGWGFGTGLNSDYRVKKHFGFGVFIDYNIHPSYSLYSEEFAHSLTPGFRTTIRF